MRSPRSGLVTAGIVVAGLVGAVAIAVMGPSTTVVCGEGNLLDRLARRIMQQLGAGHIDGATASYCVVPSTTAWLEALGVLVVSVLIASMVSRRRIRTSAGTALLKPGRH